MSNPNYVIQTSPSGGDQGFTVTTTPFSFDMDDKDTVEIQAAILLDIIKRRVPGLVSFRLTSLMKECDRLPVGMSEERTEFWEEIDNLIARGVGK